MHPLIAALYAATLQFGVGSLLATALSDWRAEVTAGFLRLAAVVALAGIGLAYLLVGGAEAAEQGLALVLLALSLVYAGLQFGGRRATRLAVGGLAALVGGAGLLLAAWARPSPFLGPGWTAFTALASASALGASTMAMVLGHWYLMTPRLSARPLRRLCDLAIVSLLVVSGVGIWYVAANPAAAAVGPDEPVFRWSGLLAVTVFPVGVAAAARICCRDWPRGRAIQAATGLLYIVVALALAGALAGNMVLLTSSE